MTARSRITADTVRHARKHLANEGWRNDGRYFDPPLFDNGDTIGEGPACTVGAVAIAHGTLHGVEKALRDAFSQWSSTDFDVIWWNDHQATADQVDQFLAWYQARLEETGR